MPTLAPDDLGWASLTLCVWWALWSLADAYLLVYTPWSELAALTLSVSAHGVVCCCEAYRRRQHPQRYARRHAPLADAVELRSEHVADATVPEHALVE